MAPTLEVVMIVKNEAGCLADCLEAVRGVADAILVADTGSTDETVSVARRFGARVIDVPWRDDFAEARNACLAEARGDWLLHLDADEVVDPAGAARIRELVDLDGDGADAIEVTLANYCDDPRAWRWRPVAPGDPHAQGHAGYIEARLLRLFRNRRGFEYREAVHENITESVAERGGVVRAEPIVIHHYGYSKTTEGDRAKSDVYRAMALRKVDERPRDPKAWHDLAELEFAAGNGQAAEAACRRALEIEPLHLGAGTSLANILLNRDALDEAEALLRQFEDAGVVPPHIATALGAIDTRKGWLDQARQRLAQVLSEHPEAVMARLCLARALDRLGAFDEAARHLAEAQRVAPSLDELGNRVEAHRLRRDGENLFARGDVPGALRAMVKALSLDAEDPIIHNDLGVVLSAMGERRRARESFERALQLAPGMPEALENLAALERG